MKNAARVLQATTLSSLLLSTTASLSWAQPCSSPSYNSSELSIPAEQTRTIEAEGLGIAFEIPDNYRSAVVGGIVHVLTPESYDYLQCRLEHQPQDDDYPVSILLYRSEAVGRSQIQREAESRSGQLLREGVIDGQPAFVYTSDGMTKGLFVRVLAPDRSHMVTVRTTIDRTEVFSIDETFERIVSTLAFL